MGSIMTEEARMAELLALLEDEQEKDAEQEDAKDKDEKETEADDKDAEAKEVEAEDKEVDEAVAAGWEVKEGDKTVETFRTARQAIDYVKDNGGFAKLYVYGKQVGRKIDSDATAKKLLEGVEESEIVALVPELSEEAQEKIAILFKTAVDAQVKHRVAEEVALLEDAYDAKLAEAKEQMMDQADKYLTSVVNEWTEANAPAIEHKLKHDIMESFMADLSDLFKKHNINVSESEYKLAESLQADNDALAAKLSESKLAAERIAEELSEAKKELTRLHLSEGMTELDKAKFFELMESHAEERADKFEKTAKIVKESFFGKKREEVKAIDESVQEAPKQDDAVARLMASMRSMSRGY
nr:MAG TPA: Scaffold protein [Caudoviricetes sp.]